MTDRDKLFSYSDGNRYSGKTNSEVFGEIFQQSTWNVTNHDSVSGDGSNAEQTAHLREALTALLHQLSIKQILDIPCGDFHWMQQLDLTGIKYIGADLVPELIKKNHELYAQEDRRFVQVDLCNDPLPGAELIFCRDCLVHLSLADIRLALNNIAQSNATWLFTTHFTEEDTNKDIVTGGWRPLNFCLPPFRLPPPVHLINEGCTEKQGAFRDKSIAGWKVNTIKEMVFLNTDR